MPGAYEKPQLVPLQQTRESDLPPIFTFHVNPVLNPKLHVELEEKLLVLQVSEQRQREEQRNESVYEKQVFHAPTPTAIVPWHLLHRVTQTTSWRLRPAS